MRLHLVDVLANSPKPRALGSNGEALDVVDVATGTALDVLVVVVLAHFFLGHVFQLLLARLLFNLLKDCILDDFFF